jgi:hypothetical protein
LHEGVLSIGPGSANTFVHVDLGSHDGPVEVFFFDDPTEPLPFTEPAPVADERYWFQKAADSVISGAEWIGEVGMGDFNENMTTAQIITNAIVTAVPVVDQVADARDLVANGKALIWDKRYNEIAVWVGVFACLIGLIPSLGSLAKGVIKIIWKNAGEMGRLLIYINRALHKTGIARINGYRFVKELGESLAGKVDEVATKFDEFLNACRDKANFFGMTQVLATIEEVRAMARAKFQEVATEISARIARGIAKFATTAWRMFPGQALVVRRSMVVARVVFEEWQETMVRIGFNKNAVEAGAEPMDAATRRAIAARDALAARWTAEFRADPNLPASLRAFLENDEARFVNMMTTFGSKPRAINFSDEATTLYRVIDQPGKIEGNFWSRAEPPGDEATWRSRDAVRNDWNEGGAYVSASVPPPPAGFVGTIGPQASQNDPTKMLRGGGEQVYIPGRPAVPEEQIEHYFHTNWNERAPVVPSRATFQAGRTGECDL